MKNEMQRSARFLKMLPLLKTFFSLVSLGTLYAFHAKETILPKPNVIVILMDDMGYADPEVYGGIQYRTPNINRLAAEGIRFTNFYSAQPVCSASRAALLTGCYPNRVGISGALHPWDKKALNPEEEIIPVLLKRAGYKTGMIGKWHLGAQAPYLPIHYGFDEFFGLPYSNDMWPVGFDGKPVTDSTAYAYKNPPLPLLEGDSTISIISTLQQQGLLTRMYTERAKQFIRQNKNHPFFLYLAHSMVHVPIYASSQFLGKSGVGLFGDMMMEVDWSVGEIMQIINELGLDKNTLILFTSDNGPWLSFGNHAGSTGGFREGKGTTFEGGQRVPFIAKMPGVTPAGTICNRLAVNIDLLPSLVKLCGASMPKNKIDGVDIVSLLKGDIYSNPRNEMVYYYNENSLQAIRVGKWKYVFPHNGITYKQDLPGQNGYAGKTRRTSVPAGLYDLSTDPGETQDVQALHPDAVKMLLFAANKYRGELGDDLTNIPCSECRLPARLK